MIIGGKEVNKNSDVLIIAEAGINHDGNLDQAYKLIDIASDAGADVVKFQLFTAEKMYSSKAGMYETAGGKNEEIVSIIKKNELPVQWLMKLKNYCKKKNIGFLSTVCDEESANILNDHNVDSFKLASYAITHEPLLRHVSKFKKPMIISTAGANLSDLDEAVRIIEHSTDDIGIMHCVAKYPTPLEECNLNIIKTFKLAYPDYIIGYSDHTAHPYFAPVAAVVNGAKIIEKHFTLDKNLSGADHSFSLSPDELSLMVTKIRETERMLETGITPDVAVSTLGTSRKKTTSIEKPLREYAYRTIIAIKDLNEGDSITVENIAVLRPGEVKPGLNPKMFGVLIKLKPKVRRKISAGNSIQWEDILNV